MQYSICTLPGDGIGPEIVREAKKVLEKIAELEGFRLEFTEKAFGGAAIDLYGGPLPEDTLEACKASEAVLMGSIGGKVGISPWYSLPVEKRPEAGLLSLRKQLGLFCNLRPAKLYKELRDACPLKEEIIGDGFDIMMIRELTGGLYFGKRSITEENGEEVARDELIYRAHEIERIGRIAFSLAKARGGKLCSVDKANVLDSSRLWRKIFTKLGEEEKEVELRHALVDSTAMELVRNPRNFSVIVTENMFGDILSDEMAEIAGSLGMLPSASLGENASGYCRTKYRQSLSHHSIRSNAAGNFSGGEESGKKSGKCRGKGIGTGRQNQGYLLRKGRRKAFILFGNGGFCSGSAVKFSEPCLSKK